MSSVKPIEIGSKVPDCLVSVGNKHVKTGEFFGGKSRVILFGLPGAFTPTCASKHVPAFELYAELLMKHGNVDSIYCLSMNDQFVMDAWFKSLKISKVIPVADWTGEFTKAMGLTSDKTELGLGLRSWRYSAIIEDGVIKNLYLENTKEGDLKDPFSESSAEKIMQHYKVPIPDSVLLITKAGCHFCEDAKNLLNQKGMKFAECELPVESACAYEALRAISPQATTTPRVFVNGTLIGGASELKDYLAKK